MTKVYSAFPGVGKTTYFNTTDRNVLDSDSSKFDKKHFPDNYIEHIKRNVEDPKVDKILVSSHKDVRDALLKNGIPFVLVYPDRSLKDEYIQRYKERGNNDAFVDLLDKNWDNWMDEMDQLEAPQGQTLYKVKLRSGQYLTDVLGLAMTPIESLIGRVLPFIDRTKVSDAELQRIVEDHLIMEKDQREKDFINGYKACAKMGGQDPIFDEIRVGIAKELFKIS